MSLNNRQKYIKTITINQLTLLYLDQSIKNHAISNKCIIYWSYFSVKKILNQNILSNQLILLHY